MVISSPMSPLISFSLLVLLTLHFLSLFLIKQINKHLPKIAKNEQSKNRKQTTVTKETEKEEQECKHLQTYTNES